VLCVHERGLRRTLDSCCRSMSLSADTSDSARRNAATTGPSSPRHAAAVSCATTAAPPASAHSTCVALKRPHKLEGTSKKPAHHPPLLGACRTATSRMAKRSRSAAALSRVAKPSSSLVRRCSAADCCSSCPFPARSTWRAACGQRRQGVYRCICWHGREEHVHAEPGRACLRPAHRHPVPRAPGHGRGRVAARPGGRLRAPERSRAGAHWRRAALGAVTPAPKGREDGLPRIRAAQCMRAHSAQRLPRAALRLAQTAPAGQPAGSSSARAAHPPRLLCVRAPSAASRPQPAVPRATRSPHPAAPRCWGDQLRQYS
jgi:hypothetical protein